MTREMEICSACQTSMKSSDHVLPSGLSTQVDDAETLSREIYRTKQALAALEDRYDRLRTSSTESSTKPSRPQERILPSELLSIIFNFACTSFKSKEYKTALSLSLVCTEWRTLTLSLPTLWTNIYFSANQPQRTAEMCSLYEERSSSLPLSVKLAKIRDDIPQALLEACLRSAPRWKMLHLDIAGDVPIFNALIYHRCTTLETLVLSCNEGLEYTDLGALPLLKYLTLHGKEPFGGFVWPRFYYQFDLGQLSEVKITHWDVGSISARLDDAFQGTLIIGEGAETAPLFVSLDSTLSFGGITGLVLRPPNWNAALARFFERADIPNLEEYTLVLPDPAHSYWHLTEEWFDAMYSLLDFFRASGCPLRVFDFSMSGRFGLNGPEHDYSMVSNIISDILATLPRLEKVRLVEPSSGAYIMSDQLLSGVASGEILPDLKTLEMVFSEGLERREHFLRLLVEIGQRCSSLLAGMRDGFNSLYELRKLGVHAVD